MHDHTLLRQAWVYLELLDEFDTVSSIRGRRSFMKTILVIDDEDDLRAMVVKALKAEGFETIEADNGSSALTLARNRHPDLIISDVIMDSGSGFMLQELLREDPATASIPLILMSGHAKHVGAWQSDSATEYLAKPFGLLELLASVARKLGPKSGS